MNRETLSQIRCTALGSLTCTLGFSAALPLVFLACSIRLSWQHRNILSRARSGKKEIKVPSVYTVGKCAHYNWNRRPDCLISNDLNG